MPVTVLVVDDSATVRDLLSRRLGRKGYSVLVAGDGQEGVDVARRSTPDVIIMDLHMPVLDGWQAARELRKLDETRTIPILALTAYDSSRDRSAAIDSGCNDFDSKPISMPRLIAKLERLLGIAQV